MILLALASIAQATPLQYNHQGRLLDTEGNGLSGEHELTFRIVDESDAVLWEESLSIDFQNGYYSVHLGEDETNNPLDDSIFAAYPLWMELSVDGDTLEPRHPIQSVPYANIAGMAESVDGGSVNASDISINGTQVVDGAGNWVGPQQSTQWEDIDGVPPGLDDGDDDTQLDESTVESYITNDVIDLQAGSTAGGKILVTAPPTCTDGQLLSFDASSQNWTCVTLNVPTCGDGQLQIYNSTTSSWVCSDFANVIDQDGDGALAWNDCNDADASFGDKSADADCDGVLTALDCDDNDASSTTVATDADCDGEPTTSDCDDGNPLITTSGTGATASCAATSCSEILSNNASTGDASYWIDPLSSGAPFQVDCIMSSDGGGWIALSPNTSDSLYMSQSSNSNPWRKCGDDSAKHYSWISEGAVTADYTGSSATNTDILGYKQPSTGSSYSAAQLSAMRTVVSELSSSTRLVAVTADDDSYSYEDGDTSGHEVYLGDENGTYTVMTPGTNGECGNSTGWGQSEAAHYLWASSASDSIVDGVTGMTSSQLGALPSSLVIPYDFQLATYSGGGASFGWENEEFWVR